MKTHGFSRKERIAKNWEYREAFREGKKISTDFFVAFFNKKENLRLGISVSKKVGNACLRNRVKRQIREFFRLNKKSFPIGDIVFVAKPKISSLDNSAIRREIKKAAERLKNKQ